jgi:predicted AlkP superfamily phosphohydrolase/phosphomutase
MALRSQPRIAVVGIDGFSPMFLERYLNEGVMPSLQKLAARGVTVPLVSTLPATTPVAWAAMSTGTHPSRNGIEGFLLHRPGRRFDDRVNGVYADQLLAEPIWQTAFLHGRSSFVVKFPLSYPSTAATLRVDGAAGWGGLTCLHEVAASGTNAWPAEGASAVTPAPVWRGEPLTDVAPLWFGTLTLPNLWGRAPVLLHLALGSEGSELRLSIATEPDWSRLAATLASAGWSEPIILTAVDRGGEPRQCALRIKALELSSDPIGLRLFNTPVHNLNGHSSPAARWERHLKAAGPIEEQTDPTPLFSGAIDVATHVDRCRLNTDWLCRISRSILENERWHLFMVHTHIVDWAHHILHGAVDPRHPLYEPARADEADALLRLFYAMADELVAHVADAGGPEANIVVMGDHGQDLHHTTVRFNRWLAEIGHLSFSDDDGRTIDWSRTRACVLGNGVYLNIAGRDPDGIVSPHESEALIEELCGKLLGILDPRTGDRVVAIAAPREHFSFLGGNGRGAGDIVFCLRSGYQARNDAGPKFELTRPWREFTSGHDHFWPLDPRLQSRMFAVGPAFASPQRPVRPHSIVDVAPTIAAVLGIEPPPDIDGVAIAEILGERTMALAGPRAEF